VPLPRRLRQLLVTTAVVVVVLVLAGATYQGVATALERRRFPHPGQLVDVGGHQLHLYCLGDGSPAVVLEAPATGFSAVWGWIQPALAATTRTCSYDRAGLGWSEAGDAQYDPGRVAAELHALLNAAGIDPPYVLAGQSLGGAFVRLYAARYPEDTAGLVLIDATHPDAVSGADRAELDRFRLGLRLAPWAARAGLLRLTGTLSSAARGLPEQQEGAATSFLNRPDHLTRSAAEFEALEATMDLVSQSGGLGDLPLLILPAGAPPEGPSAVDFAKWQQLQRTYLKLSTDSTLREVPGGTHASMLTDRGPALFIATQIRGLVERLRASQR
jgi:pimeloyl-ACP methyl ester carboxylesterase